MRPGVPLDLDGSLEIQVDEGVRVRLAALGAALALELPDWRAARAVLAPLGKSEGRQLRLLQLASALEAAELRLAVHLAGVPFASLNGRWRPSLVSRALGLAPLAVRPWRLVRGTGRSVLASLRSRAAPA